MIYLLRIEEKTTATRFVTAGMAGFTIGTAFMFATSIVLWGGALSPMIDAWAVFGMAAMIGFGYHYPQKVRSLEARFAFIFASSIALISLSFSFYYAYQILVNHRFDIGVQDLFWFLNPLTFLAALIVSIRRTLVLQRQKTPRQGWRETLLELYHPRDRQVRLLRNFSLALSLGLIQGLAYGFELAGLLHPLLAPGVVDLSLLLMVVAIVYASFDLTHRHPGLIIRMVGLSLVTLPAILGFLGIYTVNTAMERVDGENIQSMEMVRKTVRAGNLSLLPNEVVYVIAWPVAEPQETTLDYKRVQLLYERQPGFDSLSLGVEHRQSIAGTLPKATWMYSIEKRLRMANRTVPVQLRYGTHLIGSYHQYAGYSFIVDGSEYEVGFSLGEMSKIIHNISLGMVSAVIVGSLFIVMAFPQLFRTNLIRPLDRLLEGVRRADAGDLDILVPVIHNDEVGFLTAAFNKMTASLREELSKRRRAEKELLELTSTLEQRIIDRTRELTALYDVSAVASQAQDSQTLLTESLTRTMEALLSTAGMIFLQDEDVSETHPFRLITHQGIPSDWFPNVEVLSAEDGLFDTVIAQRTPLLIPDVAATARLPATMRKTKPTTLLFAPLQAEGRVLGVLGLARELGESFDLDEVALLVSIADQIGVAVQNDRLRQRAQRVIMLEERQRLARDLHDSVTQSLYGLVTLTEAGMVRLESGTRKAVQHTFARIGQTARQAIREMRLFIHQLRPPVLEQEGLVNALDLRLAAVEGRSDVQARLHADEDIHLSLRVETALFHIAQEALNNTLKHAQADSVYVNMFHQNQNIVMEIMDDGCGFDTETVKDGCMGLANMRERVEAIGGELEIISHLGEGTRIKVTVSSG